MGVRSLVNGLQRQIDEMDARLREVEAKVSIHDLTLTEIKRCDRCDSRVKEVFIPGRGYVVRCPKCRATA